MSSLQLAAESPAQVPQKRILVADDIADLRTVVGIFLRKAGHEAILASSAEEAWALIEMRPPDAVLTDVHMLSGGMTGIDLARKVREKLPPEIPIIIMSDASAVSNGSSIVSEVATIPNAEFLAKSFHPQVVVDKFGAIFARQAALANTQP